MQEDLEEFIGHLKRVSSLPDNTPNKSLMVEHWQREVQMLATSIMMEQLERGFTR
jgi:hypothetical protein